MILPDTDAIGAIDLAERVRVAVEASSLPHAGNPPFNVVTVSIGVATSAPFEVAESLGQILLERGDAALYRAKDGGRNRVCAGRSDEGKHSDAERTAKT